MARSDINSAGKRSASSPRAPQGGGDFSSSSSGSNGFDTEWLDDSGKRDKSRADLGKRGQSQSSGSSFDRGSKSSEFDQNGDYVGRSGEQPSAASLADGLRDAASSTAQVVKEQASAVVNEVGHELGRTAEEQMGRGADAIRGFARAMEAASSTIEQQSPQLARAINDWATKVDDISDRLGNRRVNELFDTATDFARKQPAIFLGAAIVTGFALARFLKSSAKSRTDFMMRDGMSGMDDAGMGRTYRERSYGQSSFSEQSNLSDDAGYSSNADLSRD